MQYFPGNMLTHILFIRQCTNLCVAFLIFVGFKTDLAFFSNFKEMSTNEDIPLIMVDPHWVDGIPYPGIIKEDNIRNLNDLTVFEDDIFLPAYHKSGIFRTHFIVLTNVTK